MEVQTKILSKYIKRLFSQVFVQIEKELFPSQESFNETISKQTLLKSSFPVTLIDLDVYVRG